MGRRSWILGFTAFGMTVAGVPALAADVHEPVTLTMSNIWNGTRVPLMNTVLERFHEKYPWITVKNVITDGTFSKELAGIAAGSPVDVLMVDRLRLAEFAENNLLIPLDSFIKQDNFDLSIFYPPEVEASQYQGHTYVLPMPAASLGLLYYNRTMFSDAGLNPDKPPTTWAEFTDMGKRLSKLDASGKTVQSGGNINYFPRYLFAQLGYLNGATVFQGNGLDVDYLSPNMQEAANWAADFMKSVAQGGSVQNETAAMETNGEWYYFYAKQKNAKMDVGISLLPHGPNGKSLNLVGAAWSFGVPAGVKHPYESWLLVKFLTSSEEGAKYFTLEQGRPSPVRAFNQDQRYYAQNPYWNVIGQALAQGVVAKRSPITQKIVDADIKWYHEMMNGNQSPKGALTQLQNAVEALIKDYNSTKK